MKIIELETSRETLKNDTNINKITELLNWFRYTYQDKLNTINRYNYLGIPCDITRYELEYEAYLKENELRELQGLEKLPIIKNTKLL